MLLVRWRDKRYMDSLNCTDLIPDAWLAVDRRLERREHVVLSPDGSRDNARCNVWVKGAVVELDYRPYEPFNRAQGMDIGVMRIEFSGPTRKDAVQVRWKAKGKQKFDKCKTKLSLQTAKDEFQRSVERSSKLSSTERRKRLARARKTPDLKRVRTWTFVRNPDVVAEVLHRARGKCQGCNRRAPFQRLGTGDPYLEVHHRIRLADGGQDTVENAEALCPNCHRERHYG